MKFLRMWALGSAAVLGAGCTAQDSPEVVPAPRSLGPAVVRDGIVYTPASVGPQGCVRYNIGVPGGQAPAAMAYQSAEGTFSYERPNRCVTPNPHHQ